MLDLFAARALFALSIASHGLVCAGALGAPLMAALWAQRGWQAGAEEWWHRARILRVARLVSGALIVAEVLGLFPGLASGWGSVLALPLVGATALLVLQGRMLRSDVGVAAALKAGLVGLAALYVGYAGPTWLQVPTDGADASVVSALLSLHLPVRWLHLTLGMLVLVLVVTGVRLVSRSPRSSGAADQVQTVFSLTLLALVLQAGLGAVSARQASIVQPAKVAAMTASWAAPVDGELVLFGLPLEYGERTEAGLKLPVAPLLVHPSATASVALKAMPASDRPWVAASYVLLHLKLVGWGVLVLGSLLGFGLAGPAQRSRLARVVIYGVVVPFAPLVFLAGLMVAAVGQQPWLVHGLMRLGDGFVAWSGVVVVGAVGVLGMAVAAGVLFRRLRSIDRA